MAISWKQQLKDVTHKLDPALRRESIVDLTDPNTSGRVAALTLGAQTTRNSPVLDRLSLRQIYYLGDFEP